VAEAIIDQVAATGGGLGAWGRDPIDGDVGFKRAGSGNREVPYWTRERARDYSVTAYRSNPMATAIIDTYTAFCVGDSGVSWQATNPQVGEIVREFWEDPANRVGEIQEIELRSQLLLGEKLQELMVAEHSGVVRFCPIDPAHIKDITSRAGNPLWPGQVRLPPGPESENDRLWDIVHVDDATGLRNGRAMFWAPWRTLDTDTRGMPFLTSILDWLDSYDTVLSNLIDRTALARYMVWDVTVKGGQPEVNAFVDARGGTHVPPSGSVEVHNDSVTWEPKTVSTGAMEDAAANQSVLTMVASGTGLAKTWLAEPEGANRATSLTMAEPVRRRVGSLQKVWLAQQAERVRFVVDRAVAAKRLPAMVDATDPRTGETTQIRASQAVTITGPEIAASDSQLTAQVLLNLSTGLEKLQQIGALSPEAAKTAARKAWEDYVGVPYTAELDSSEANPDDVAEVVESARRTRERHRAGGPRDYVRDGDGQFAATPGFSPFPAAAAAAPTSAPMVAPAVSPAADPLKLAGRIKLAPGETFGGSARVHDRAGDATVVLARIDGPGGPRLRLGVVNPDDTKTWQAGNKGRTVELDPAAAGQLRDLLGQALTDGKKNVADFRAELRQANKEDRSPGLWPAPEADIGSGVIGAGWGAINWRLSREEGDDYSAGGADLGPGGKWSLALDPAPTGADASREPFYAEDAATINQLAKALTNLMGPAVAQESQAGDGGQLKDYWTKGEGLARWATSPHPWTALRNHLAEHMPTDRADQVASQWFHDVFGMWPGERKGDNPVGPG
jgi:hypothetical protein